ncbi:MAG: 5'-nucleotidase [Planctomycetia bacterium]|nr:5'-nucleotidase [Planctomycetia bacterium]
MPVDLSKSLVIGISSRALFDLEESNKVFETDGEAAYAKYQEERKDEPLKPGIGFRLVQAILGLNSRIREKGVRKAEVVVTSRNSPATSMRLFNSISHHDLDIQRAILTGGTPVARYLKSFCVDLYLSAYESDVEEAINAGIAAGVIYTSGTTQEPSAISSIDPVKELRFAFDGDNVLFNSEAEDVFQREKLEGFVKHEVTHSKRPLGDGPFAKLLRTLAVLQKDPGFENPPIRTALVTARSLPTHLRVLNTFRAWGIHVDEAFFMGGVDKSAILSAFQPHIFFDDQDGHCRSASQVVSTARVPITREAEASTLACSSQTVAVASELSGSTANG